MLKVLALQDESYYSELGVDFSGFSVVFGFPISLSARKALRKFDLVVSCLDHDAQAYRVICLANDLEIPTVYISDGIYDVENSKENPMMKKAGRQQLFPAVYGTVFCVGDEFSSWYRGFFPSVNVYSYLPRRASLDVSRVVGGISGTVLITTALTPYFNEEDLNSVVASLVKLIDLFDEGGVDYSFRVFDENIIRRIPVISSKNDKDGSLTDAMKGKCCVVSTTSTVLFTCFAYGIPSLLLNHRNSEVLYGVDMVVDASVELDLGYFSSVVRSKRPASEVELGVRLSDFNYSSPQGLKRYEGDFSNFGVGYHSRRVYRKMSPQLRKKIKGLLP